MAADAPKAAPLGLQAGTLLGGRYRIERMIGAGGMGFVYAARHEQLGELVAVKTLHAKHTADAESIERFLREARACAKIKNDHVVRVLDVSTGENGAPPYIVMEFLEGCDLGSVVEENAVVPVSTAVDYVLQACEAIAEAHARGIIHRDIKPSNFFLCTRSDGGPLIKVVDFGISKSLAADGDNASLTETHAVFGSPAYMSPEQVRSAKKVDARSDVWSLGVLLFELLAKRLPFDGETSAGVLAAISADPPRPLRAARVDVPEALEGVIFACLKKQREERVQSVGELAILLRAFASADGQRSADVISRAPLSGRSVQPPPMPSSSQLAYGATDRGISTTTAVAGSRKPMYLGAAALLVAIAIGTSVVMLQRRTTDAPTLSAPTPPFATTTSATSATSATTASAAIARSISAAPDAIASAPVTSGAGASATSHPRNNAGRVAATLERPAISQSVSAAPQAPPAPSSSALDVGIDRRY